MTTRVDLVLIGGGGPAPAWSLGDVVLAEPNPQSVAHRLQAMIASVVAAAKPGADAALCWSAALGQPDEALILNLLDGPDDGWHAGLSLGLAGLPRLIDAVAPTWMLNRDPDPTIDATSWRLDLRACLFRTTALARIGTIDTRFDSLTAAGLELGHRWISRGARLRHVPGLVPPMPDSTTTAGPSSDRVPDAAPISLTDELRFVACRYDRRWMGWAALGELRRPASLARAIRTVLADPPPPAVDDLVPPPLAGAAVGTVTVLVPTVERYPFLRVVLDQLRGQTVPAHQIVVVDQTPEADRDPGLFDEFADLPLHALTLDPPGQCSARNAGLAVATGDYVLFIDDDDEIPADLIESHLQAIAQRRVDVSSGVVHEARGPALSAEFQRFRVADTFPTNNSLVRRAALDDSGWFDLAYDRGDRADHDLGMRLYLSGARMVMDPTIDVLHHHAPRGGLRVHNARSITYGGSRRSISVRQTLSPTQVYLWRRYYSPSQVRKAIRLHIAAGLFGTGPKWRRTARLVVQTISIPVAMRETQRAERLADQLAEGNPRIPGIPSEGPGR